MKLIIFAGGSGRRLWPLSRQRSPKQFEPIIDEKSTLQLAIDRVAPVYGLENVFISTNDRYRPLIAAQLPELPAANLIGEPSRRDLAAAVGLAMTHIARRAAPDEPVAILWGDNYMSEVATFRSVLAAAEELVRAGEARIVFMGETPRFANNNLGWIGLGERCGEVGGRAVYAFNSLTYRPPLAECRAMYAAGTHVWNTGYFVTTAGFIRDAYRRFQPEMAAGLATIEAAIGTTGYEEALTRVYPTLPVQSFDDAILEHIPPAQALVLHDDMGWSDPGTLYALKEALSQERHANVVQGLVVEREVSDSLLYNLEEGKLVAVVGLEGAIVVNMDDVLLVVHKDNIPLVKQLVNDLEGTDLDRYS